MEFNQKLFNKTNLLQSPGEIDKLYILATVLALLSIFSVSLFIGVINQNRMFIAPWIWLKYALVALQVIRFVSVIIELAASDKNSVGASPIFELLLLGEFLLYTSVWSIFSLFYGNLFPFRLQCVLVEHHSRTLGWNWAIYIQALWIYASMTGKRQLCGKYFSFFLNLTLRNVLKECFKNLTL